MINYLRLFKSGKMIDVEETAFDVFLRYGLFFGAIFQLVCIGAAIFCSDASPESHHCKVRNLLYSQDVQELLITESV